jgi:hypothetical protein
VIEPTATAIAYLRDDATLRELVGDNIASQSRYGMSIPGWTLGEAGIALVPVGGQPANRIDMIEQRFEARCSGDGPDAALEVSQALLRICRDFARGDRVRVPVSLPTGETALLYWFLHDDSVQADIDPDLRNTSGDQMDVVRVPVKIAVASVAVEE